MADRGLALLDADTLLVLIEERGELRVAASSGERDRARADRPRRGQRARRAVHRRPSRWRSSDPAAGMRLWLHELGVEVRAALVEPLSMEGQGGGMVIALRTDNGASADPTARRCSAFATSVAQRLAAERSVEIERLRYGMEARERERTRWAREIHDESIQGMGALRLRLANARDIDDPTALREAVDDGARRPRQRDRRPAPPDHRASPRGARRARAGGRTGGARPARAGDRRARRADPRSTSATRPTARRLDAELESTIYRIVQEALTNVSRHAEATKAVVSVTESDGVISASVTDDGKGLPDAERLGPRGDGLEGGFGMGGMRERAELVGGELEFGPAPMRGTTVRLVVPLAGRPSPEAMQAAEATL